MAPGIRVEVVFATAERQRLLEVTVPEGSTVADAIADSRIADRFPGADFDAFEVGIWGRVVSRDQVLAEGDRVEIYRPLALDPREARRRLASLGRTMGSSGKG